MSAASNCPVSVTAASECANCSALKDGCCTPGAMCESHGGIAVGARVICNGHPGTVAFIYTGSTLGGMAEVRVPGGEVVVPLCELTTI